MASTTTDVPVYFDPFDSEIRANPYTVYQRLRDEVPLYYNDRYDFYMVSRFDDVDRVLLDRETFISSHGGILTVLKAPDMRIPPGLFIFEDAPIHTRHRGLVSRLFTPRRVASLEPQIRDFCARTIDPHIGSGRFDFVLDLGFLPMRVIGMLLGIPEEDQLAVREYFESHRKGTRVPRDDFSDVKSMSMDGIDIFGDYIDWRRDHPSDDLMTELLGYEFEDETGTVRKLTRDEVLTYVNMLGNAGSDTTKRLLGWAGKVLAEHSDQRAQLVEDPSLIPGAIEELLRFEPPPYHLCRYVARDVEFHGQVVPEGSALVCSLAAANRDDRQFPQGDSFDIRRNPAKILTFGCGAHFCLGAALARLEARVALDEVLQRFPTWEVDWGQAQLAQTSDLRGWERLPVLT